MTKGNVTSRNGKKREKKKRTWQLLKKGQIKMLQAAVKFSYPEPFKYIIALQNLDFCTLPWSCYLVWITLLSEVHMSRKAQREHAEWGDDHREPWCREHPPAAAPRRIPGGPQPAPAHGCAQHGPAAAGKTSLGTATGHLLRPSTPTSPRGSYWFFLFWIPVSDLCTLRMRQTLWRFTAKEKEAPKVRKCSWSKGTLKSEHPQTTRKFY